MERRGEGRAERQVEVVGVPWYPVVAVKDVGVCVVPGPVYELHRGDVIRQVHHHLNQSSYKMFRATVTLGLWNLPNTLQM